MAKQFQRRRFFLEINQLETIITCGGHVCKQIGKKLAIVIEGLPSFGSFGQAVLEEIFLEINQSETSIAYGGLVC